MQAQRYLYHKNIFIEMFLYRQNEGVVIGTGFNPAAIKGDEVE